MSAMAQPDEEAPYPVRAAFQRCLQQDNAVARPVASLSRAEVLTRYRHFREISKQHYSAVLNFLPKDTVISQARRIGLAQGKNRAARGFNGLR
jgi:hypothetical protein